MDKKIIQIAANVLKISEEQVEMNYKEIPNSNAFYFWNPVRGGLSVIINSNYEKLAASSAVDFNRHFAAFNEGKRN